MDFRFFNKGRLRSLNVPGVLGLLTEPSGLFATGSEPADNGVDVVFSSTNNFSLCISVYFCAKICCLMVLASSRTIGFWTIWWFKASRISSEETSTVFPFSACFELGVEEGDLGKSPKIACNVDLRTRYVRLSGGTSKVANVVVSKSNSVVVCSGDFSFLLPI